MLKRLEIQCVFKELVKDIVVKGHVFLLFKIAVLPSGRAAFSFCFIGKIVDFVHLYILFLLIAPCISSQNRHLPFAAKTLSANPLYVVAKRTTCLLCCKNATSTWGVIYGQHLDSCSKLRLAYNFRKGGFP